MSLKIFAKRIAPFLATFAVGLFVASFFVSIALPTFQFRSRNFRRQQEINRLESENDQLRENSCQLRRRNAELEKQNTDSHVTVDYTLDVPPPPPMPPAPPKVAVAPRVR